MFDDARMIDQLFYVHQFHETNIMSNNDRMHAVSVTSRFWKRVS